MKVFPGNNSEKPIIRNVIESLKSRNSISGRTIQIADKGLNCGDNIFHAVKNGDGYIFSKSVKQLPKKEIDWVLLKNDYVNVTFSPADKNGNETDGKINVSLNYRSIKKSRDLAGYNMIITSELNMSDGQIYNAYHNLWRIEESFRVMKSQLDARPVYLQKQDTITGHFLICYLAVLLERILQFKILNNSFCSEAIFDFAHDFRAIKISDRKYINISKNTTFIREFATLTNLPLTSYFLSDGDIKKMLSHKF